MCRVGLAGYDTSIRKKVQTDVVRRRWRAVPAREILPAAAAAQHEENAFECPAVVGLRPPGPGTRRQERLDDSPLAIGEAHFAHAQSVAAALLKWLLGQLTITRA